MSGHDGERDWFYLSFVDPDRPAGMRWLGGCFVQGFGEVDAASEAWRLGCNPGGQVAIYGLSRAPAAHLRNRLLSREEVEGGQMEEDT